MIGVLLVRRAPLIRSQNLQNLPEERTNASSRCVLYIYARGATRSDLHTRSVSTLDSDSPSSLSKHALTLACYFIG